MIAALRFSLAVLACLLALPALAAFTDHGDGTVTDSATGLMWDKCTWGQTGNGCSGSASLHTWSASLGLAVTANSGSHKGYSDWRLPNKNELESLIDLSRSSPAIDTTAFPNTPISGDSWGNGAVWSSTTYAPNAADAWSVLFYNGGTLAYDKPNSVYVRLVRNGQSFGSFDSMAVAVDTTPDAFGFTDQTGVALAAVMESNTITVAGIDSSASISVSGGEYRINGGSWTSATGTVSNGATVQVRLTSSSSPGGEASATLTIGGVQGSFSATTGAIPQPFNFSPVFSATKGAIVVSDPITIAGLAAASSISVIGGEYLVNGGSWTSSAGTVVSGDIVKVRLTGSSSAYSMTSADLTIGGVTATFAVTTAEDATIVPVWPSSNDVRSVVMQGGKAIRYFRLLSVDGHTPLANRKVKYSVNGTAIMTGTEADPEITDSDGVFAVETDWLTHTPTGNAGLPMEVQLFYDTSGTWDAVSSISFPVRITRRSVSQKGSVVLNFNGTAGFGAQVGVTLKAGGRGLRAAAALNRFEISPGVKAGFTFESTSRLYSEVYTDSQRWHSANSTNETIQYITATENHPELDRLDFEENIGGDIGVGLSSEVGLSFAVAPYRQIAATAEYGGNISFGMDAATGYTFPAFYDRSSNGGCHIGMRFFDYIPTGATGWKGRLIDQLKTAGITAFCNSPLTYYRSKKKFTTSVAANVSVGTTLSTGDISGGRNRGFTGDFGKSFLFVGFGGDIAATHTHADEFTGTYGAPLVRKSETDKIEIEGSYSVGAGFGLNLTGKPRDRDKSLKSGEQFSFMDAGYGRIGQEFKYDLAGNIQAMQRTISSGHARSAQYANTAAINDSPRLETTVFTLTTADAQRYGKSLGQLSLLTVDIDEMRNWFNNALSSSNAADFSGPVGFIVERSEVTKAPFNLELGAALGGQLEFGAGAVIIHEDKSIQQVGLTLPITAANGAISRRKLTIELYRPDAYLDAVKRNLLSAVATEVGVSLAKAQGSIPEVTTPTTPTQPTIIQVPVNGNTTLNSNTPVVTQLGSTLSIPDTGALGAQITLPAFPLNMSVSPVTITVAGQSLLVTNTSDSAVLSVRSITVNGVTQPVLVVTSGSVTFSQLPSSAPVVLVGGETQPQLLVSGTSGTSASISYNASAGQTVVSVTSGFVVLPSTSRTTSRSNSTTRAASIETRIYAGEIARFSSAGVLEQIRVGTIEGSSGGAGNPLVLNLPANLIISMSIPNLAATSNRLGKSLQDALAVAAGGQLPALSQSNGVIGFRINGNTVYALPIGEVTVNTSGQNGVVFGSDGRMTITADGVTATFVPAFSNITNFASDLA